MDNNRKTPHPLTAELKSVSQAVYDIETLLNGRGNGNGSDNHPSMSDLRTSELRYRRLFEAAQDGILLLDAETGAITDANPYILNLLGYELDEMLGKRLWEIGAFHDAAESKAGFKELQQEEYIRYEDLPLQTKDGQARQVEFVSNVYLVNGKKVIQCNIRDITERRRLYGALHESEERYRRLFETAQDGILLLDAQTGAITDANPFLTDLLGYKTEELIGKQLWELGVFIDIVASKAAFEELQQEEYIRYENLPLQTKDGQARQVEFVSNVYLVKDKKVIQCNIRDITDRVSAEKAQYESHRQYRQIIETAQEGVWIIDDENRTTLANQYLANMLGYTVAEMIGRFVYEFMDEEGKEIAAKNLENRRGGVHEQRDFKYRRKDGTTVWALIKTSPLFDDDQHYTGALAMLTDITERKQTENALRDSNEKFHQLADNITDAFWIRSPDMAEVHYLSPAFETIWGRSIQSLYENPQQWSDFISPEDRERVLAAFAALTEDSSGLDIEYRIVRPDGEIRWIRVRGFQVRDGAGTLIRHIGIVTDMTDRKRVEEELRFRNLILTTQQEASIDGILVVDEHTNIISYNSRFAQMWGVPQELIEKKADQPVLEFIADKVTDSASFRQRVQYVYGRKTESFQDEVVLKNGRIFDRYSAPMVGPDDHYYGRVWYFRDITDRKQTEKRITLLAHTLESIAECVSITDLDNIILFVNNAFLETYGYTEQEIVGKNIDVVRSPNNPPQVTREILDSALTGGWNGELLNRTKDGRDFPVSISTSSVHDDGGNVVALVGVATDITEQKKFQQQLLQSQKRESIGTLAGGIAHDFNNILAIILGYTFLIEKNRLDAQKLSEDIAAVHQAVHRGSELVRQILTFARKTEISFHPIRLTNLVRELVSLLEHTFPKIITFKTISPADLPLILADRTQIHQALLNLCVNARDAMPEGGSITITVEKQTREQLKAQFPLADQDLYLCISVADAGEGMSELTRARIFDPFFTTKPQGKGTGLGLSVVYGVIQAHQGFIHVESELNHGTVFRLYFPVPIISIKPVEPLPAKPFEAGGTETILLVEDEPDLLEMMRMLLVAKGYKVLMAHDGVEAIEVYKAHQQEIAMVLSDLGLPKMTGIEEFKRLREINPDVMVVFASGFIGPDVKSELLKGGARGFLQKPYMPDEILRMVRNTLDDRTMEA